MIELLQISERFRGPPRSGNGGYTCGRIAAHLDAPAISVRLQAPPPLQTGLRLESGDGEARLYDGQTQIGHGRACEFELDVPPCPSLASARRASEGYIGFAEHTFPGCFVCGPQRRDDDGLCIYPGALEGSTTIAAPWTPASSLSDASGTVLPEFLWAALDCPGAFTWYPLPAATAIVLGELSASIVEPVQAGEPCVVLGWPIGAEGRKRLSGTAIYNGQGRLVAKARAVWIEVPLQRWD
jgi:hypothetical protein